MRLLAYAILVAMWTSAIVAFPWLPRHVPTHWGIDGHADGWMPRFPGAFIAPLAATAVFVLRMVAPKTNPRPGPRGQGSPLRRRDLDLATALLVGFLAALQSLTLAAALGWPVDVVNGILVALGFLLMGLGSWFPRLRPNGWVGVRTPWTLTSERVWRATHRAGGRVFVGAGFLVLAAAFLPRGAQWIVALVAIGGAALFGVVYSYLAWKKERAGA